MAGEKGMIATVERQEGNRIFISLPMVGFDPGVELEPGTRVVIANEENGPAVRPLIDTFLVNNVAEDVTTGVLDADDKQFTIQPATIHAPGPITGESTDQSQGPFVVFVADPGESGQPGQVLAIRPER